MKNITMISIIILIILGSCKNKEVQVIKPQELYYNQNGKGQELDIIFTKGPEHNHPLMAIWAEDLRGNFIQTLYVAESIGKGVFKHGDSSEGKWMPGEIRRPAALPFWAHRRGIMADDGLYIPTPDNPVADAYTGPTPQQSFILHTKLDQPINEVFIVFMEINQTWDWNEFWTNNKYPDNDEYKTSCQPALVYKTIVDPSTENNIYPMFPIGHSHYAGENGELTEDLSTITTALKITDSVKLRISQ